MSENLREKKNNSFSCKGELLVKPTEELKKSVAADLAKSDPALKDIEEFLERNKIR